MRPALFLILLAACSSGGERVPEGSRDAALSVRSTDDAAASGIEPDDADVLALDGGVADPAAQLTLGRELATKQKWADAIAALEQASVGKDPRALAELAFTAVLAGDTRRAEAAARAVLAQPGLDDATRATALYHLGRASELAGDLTAARDAYTQSLALAKNPTIQDRLDRLAPRRPPPAPATPACGQPVAEADLCACLAGPTVAEPQCVKSHKHGGGAWAVTVVARDQQPTYLVVAPAKGQAQAIAAIGVAVPGVPDAELTITHWSVARGPAGAPLVRVDARMSTHGKVLREDALVCLAGAAPRCLAGFPIVEKVGTPATQRRLALVLDASDDRGVAQLTIVEGAPTPADLLGTHRLW